MSEIESFSQTISRGQDKAAARTTVAEAANTYALGRARIKGHGDSSDSEFLTAVNAWDSCPDLPEPVWPVYSEK